MRAAECYAKAGCQEEVSAVVGTSQRFLKAPKEALGSLNAFEWGLLKAKAA